MSHPIIRVMDEHPGRFRLSAREPGARFPQIRRPSHIVWAIEKESPQ